MELMELLRYVVSQNASDVFVSAGLPLSYRKNGVLYQVNEDRLSPEDTEKLLEDVYKNAGERKSDILQKTGDDDFSFAIPGLSRFRVSAYRQRGTYSAVIRIISFQLPEYTALHIPEYVLRLGDSEKGMVLVTGPAGSGKSTTLACIINRINQNQQKHIITLEDPLEYLHRHARSIVSQREIKVDTEDYATALRAALRQSPDVILLGEMNDNETIHVAFGAAGTGRLLFSTMHTVGAVNTMRSIIDGFPENQQKQISVQLSTVLTAIVSQQLVPAVNGEMVPVMEVMTVTPAVRALIRENKIDQIDAILYSSLRDDMVSIDGNLLSLYKQGIIAGDTAVKYALNPELLEKKL
ncbi:type IV pilus twitching motility protein PilT [Acetatifactor aquisgranensis]|uniref:type IV pilus twitching motility protein PilT n=1 Tax=Acetatifactor aquisgranensis TaxID=2941233 RepID=UPI002040A0F3|nr:PilT/PilU family type 4a pilus ATPase [Acetatifactor aquisgranensis]